MYVKILKSKITKMKIVKTDCKLTLKQLVAQQKCNYAINGGLYDMDTGKVNAIPLRIDGKTIATSKDGYWMMAWNTGPDICMVHSSELTKWQNAVACSTFVKNGKDTIFNYTSAQGGTRGRTGFGDDATNVHLFVTTDTNGALTPNALRDKMKSGGCLNGIMLDCGGSSQGYFDGTYVYTGRKVSYWICIWTEDQKTTVSTPAGSSAPVCPYKEPIFTVKNGSRGEGAKWVQWHLKQTTAPSITVDGIFGAKSVTALKAFQAKYGLTADGKCGALTRKKFKAVIQ